MNNRFLIYGLVALVVFLLLSEDPAVDPTLPTVSPRESGGLASSCLESFIDYNGKIMGKIKFCECTVEKFSESVASNEEYRKAFQALVKRQNADSQKPELKARALASYSPAGLVLPSDQLDVMFERFNFRYTHSHLQESYEALSKQTELLWKRAKHACSRLPAK